MAAAVVTVDIDRDAMKRQLERRANITATIKTRARHQREFKQSQNILGSNVQVQFAPKWTRHQEDYINPHLLEHERPVIAPRYGPDAACRKVRARGEKCRCSFCLTHAQTQESQKRESERDLKNVVEPARPGVRNGSKRAPRADWNMHAFDCPYSYDGDPDRLREYDEDKQAPIAQIDLLAMARPAKGKKRLARQGAIASLPRPSMKSSTLSNVDELSIEETWEHLDLDNLDISAFALNTEHRPREPDEGSEWDWDRCSQF